MIVILDSNILSLIITPDNESLSEEERINQESYQCRDWFYKLLARGAIVVVPLICDYEVRRELLLIESKSIEILDKLKKEIDFLPVDELVLVKAAELWAEARAMSQPNRNRENIDADIIIAAQWSLLQEGCPGRRVVIATKNVQDFSRITDCDHWKNIAC